MATRSTQASELILLKREGAQEKPLAELIARSEDNTPESLNYTFKWPHIVLNSARVRQHFFSKILC